MLRFVSIKYPSPSNQTKGVFDSLTPTTMVKHDTAYYLHGYADRELLIGMVNNSLVAGALTYEDHQRISCHEQNSSVSTTDSQVCGYYHIRSFPFMLATTGDS